MKRRRRIKRRIALALALACALIIAACGSSRPSRPASTRHAATPAATTPRQSAMGSVAPAGWGRASGPVPLTLTPGTRTATMYDAVTLGNIPAGAFAAAGYTAGLYPTWPRLLADFPHAHHVSIAVSAAFHADCLDVEPYDALPSQAGAWVRADLAAGFPRPCVYSDLHEMPAVRASLAAAGLKRSQYLLWLAWYRGIPGLVGDYDAVQYDDHCLGRGLDCSTVSLAFLRYAQPPYRPAPPQPVCLRHRESRAACAAAKRKIASDRRAVAASRRVLNRAHGTIRVNHCIRPYRRGVCVHAGRTGRVMAHRIAYFTARAAELQKEN